MRCCFFDNKQQIKFSLVFSHFDKRPAKNISQQNLVAKFFADRGKRSFTLISILIFKFIQITVTIHVKKVYGSILHLLENMFDRKRISANLGPNSNPEAVEAQ